MNRPRAADDFAAIRTRMEELRREREGAQAAESDLQRDPPTHRTRAVRWPPSDQSWTQGCGGCANLVQAAIRSRSAQLVSARRPQQLSPRVPAPVLLADAGMMHGYDRADCASIDAPWFIQISEQPHTRTGAFRARLSAEGEDMKTADFYQGTADAMGVGRR